MSQERSPAISMSQCLVKTGGTDGEGLGLKLWLNEGLYDGDADGLTDTL